MSPETYTSKNPNAAHGSDSYCGRTDGDASTWLLSSGSSQFLGALMRGDHPTPLGHHRLWGIPGGPTGSDDVCVQVLSLWGAAPQSPAAHTAHPKTTHATCCAHSWSPPPSLPIPPGAHFFLVYFVVGKNGHLQSIESDSESRYPQPCLSHPQILKY